jgi:hypothetical protein
MARYNRRKIEDFPLHPDFFYRYSDGSKFFG